MLGVSLVTLHNHNKKGILKPSYKIGRKPLYRLSDVLDQIQLSNYKTVA
jgi:DNA-binding transcriptional MerR regulator